MSLNEFFVRYYVGHRGAFGHEFLQFEIHSDGRLRYANNSKYKQAGLIKKECFVSDAVLTELRRIIDDSEILKEDDNLWPEPDANGKQELEIVTESDHISFMEKCDDEDNAMSYWTSKLGSLLQVQDSKDPEGLRNFYYLIQDLKCFVFALIHMHFKIKPIT